MSANARNLVIILVLAALVALVPGGGTTARVILTALSLLFLAALAWVGVVMYRQHRDTLELLGDRRRAALYGAIALLAFLLTARLRMWSSSAGSIAWLVLAAAAAYACFTVFWSSRRY
jgi:hypothetical protein